MTNDVFVMLALSENILNLEQNVNLIMLIRFVSVLMLNSRPQCGRSLVTCRSSKNLKLCGFALYPPHSAPRAFFRTPARCLETIIDGPEIIDQTESRVTSP